MLASRSSASSDTSRSNESAIRQWGQAEDSRPSQPGRFVIGVGVSLGCLLIASSTAYVPSSPLGQHTRAPTSQPTQQDAGDAFVRTEVAPPPASAPNTVTKNNLAPAAIPAFTIPPKKISPSAPAVAEAVTDEEAARAAPVASTERAPSAISPLVGTAATPDASPQEEQLSDADRALFVRRGYELLTMGDIASARLFFERAANAGDILSALEMAKTFDPRELVKVGVRGLKGDQAIADYWYQRAQSLAGSRNLESQVKENRRD